MVVQKTYRTQGHGDAIDITKDIELEIGKAKVTSGVACVFVPGSTAAITTLEFESGVVKDFLAMLDKIAPENFDYEHHKRWGDRNGAAHIRSALVGPGLTIPISEGALTLGTWQQVVLFDFDEKPRERAIRITILENNL